ncbi:MAG: hypothetical protein DDT34_02089 [Firmicutes bacterium]|nr:hypothetical protein [Bacillota bacterium]
MKKTIKIAVIASVVFALTAFLFLQGQEATRPVVVARQDIPKGTIVSAEMLGTERIPASSTLAVGMASTTGEVVGMVTTMGRATGDLIPLAAVGRERKRLQEGNGLITMALPVPETAKVTDGDIVDIVVFDHTGKSRLLEGFVVVSVTTDGRESHLVLEAATDSLLEVAPALSSRAFKLIRR